MTATLKDLTGEIAFLARELKTPVIADTFTTLGDQARTEGWSHEEYLAAVLGRQVASRTCLLYTSPSPRDRTRSRMPSSA